MAVPRLEKAGVPIVFYEDLYRRPFDSARKVLDVLGMENRNSADLPVYSGNDNDAHPSRQDGPADGDRGPGAAGFLLARHSVG